MFSALKKLVGSEPGQLRDKNIPAGLQSMNQSLQRRFAKGVQYNMKIVIRGDRNTGKSALWHRLQGKKFLEEYIPTQEIQVTSIHWNYKTTDDVVKVEVWDVVDKGKGKKRGESLKLENEPQEADTEMALDAEFLDVYKNCNGVIMMFDITKQWTFNYILRELPKVPTHVPVCVLGNQRDMGEHRVILPDDIRDFISGLNRPMGSSYIHYAESSMKNGFGLKYLHRFFNIPFLQLQRETLLRQLETNQLDIDATLEELNVQQETEDQNYDVFLEMMEARGKGPTNGQSPSSGSAIRPPACTPSPTQPQAPPQNPERPAPTSPAAPAPASAAPPPKRGLMSRLFGVATPESPAGKPDGPAPVAPTSSPRVHNVDDFVPDDGLDRSFLDDGASGAAAKAKDRQRAAVTADSDSDGEGRGGNPMVAGFQDDLDTDDEAPPKPLPPAAVPSLGVTLSSDEEDNQRGSHDQYLHNAPNSKPSTVKASRPLEKGLPSPPQQRPSGLRTDPGSLSLTLTPTPVPTQPPHHGQKKGGATGAMSDSEPESAPAQQVLSFVVDDPDFDSGGFDLQKTPKVSFPARDNLPDLSDDDFASPATKSRDSSDELEDKDSKHSSKEKKKKKKKSKEEEDKNGKKRHKHKKKEREDAGSGDDKEKGKEKDKKKEKKKSKTKKAGDVDDLEAFLAGGEGGDYEEL
ncbi:hypothetical protein AGOR_G00251210 [Albula goreensis]|uniref:Rab-like protein 6 n=1 Tax=Albula goreensis TaxID=1534307 RepID=A0A8T3CEM5_9TELE|nr:hypothetical protein AGOR_G00251210 [Albula goreensis]